MVFGHDPAVQKRHDGKARSEDKRTGFRKKNSDLRQKRHVHRTHEAAGNWQLRQGCGIEVVSAQPLGWRAQQPDQHARGNEQPRDFGFRDNGHGGKNQINRPEQLVFADAFLSQLLCAHCNNADDCSAHAIKHCLHPRETAVADVRPTKRNDHQERWEHESDTGQGGAEYPVMHISHVDTELRCQGPGRQLGQCQAFLVIFLTDPPAILDQIALHIGNKGHWAAKAKRAKAQHIHDHLQKRVSGSVLYAHAAHAETPFL